MPPLTAIVSAITGLCSVAPQLATLFVNAWAWLEHRSGGDVPGYISKVGVSISKITNSKSEKEYADAAKDLASVITKLHI